MSAAVESSIVAGASAMCECSHITNLDAIGYVRTFGNDIWHHVSHNRNMARRGVPKQINWYLREWMDYYEVSQADMIRRTGWSKATASQLYNNKQDYNPKIINEAAEALSVRRYELLMRPEEAMRLRAEAKEKPKLVHSAPQKKAVRT